MNDRENAIKCLTDIEQIMIARQDICPREELQYWIELQEGVAAAISLLKEQEAVKPILTPWIGNDDGEVVVYKMECGKCGSPFYYEEQKYCSECGTPILWESR